MFMDLLTIILRSALIFVVWVLIWRVIQPKTIFLRVLRAAVLVLCLFVVLMAIRLVRP